jgi:hypothetical protein
MSTRARCLAALMLLPLALAGVSPAASPPAVDDHVFELAGTWSCRTAAGSEVHSVGTRSGDTVDVVNDVRTAAGGHFKLEDRFEYDSAANTWHVAAGVGTDARVEGVGPPWSGSTWEVRGRDQSGTVERIRYELMSEDELRRAFLRISYESPDGWGIVSAERCRRGDTPPPVGTCVIANAPPYVVDLARPSVRDVPMETEHGVVTVAVDLDEASHVVGARILETPSPALSPSALVAARASTYQTAFRNCRPVPSVLRLSFSFGSRRR